METFLQVSAVSLYMLVILRNFYGGAGLSEKTKSW